METRLMVVGAHPDEADMYAGGTAALLAKRGVKVKFLSLTNGDAGHHEIGGGELARRRFQEAQLAATRLGIAEYEILDTHDGELLPTIEMRIQVIQRIREWAPDILIGFHPDGWGHPDNRNAGRITTEAFAFLDVPNVAPNTPALRKNILFLWMWDYGTRNIHVHNVAVDVTETIEEKLLACDAHATQFYEFAPWGRGFLHEVPETWSDRKEFILKYWDEFMYTQPAQKDALAFWYGPKAAETTQYAESFQFASFLQKPSREEVERLLPIYPKLTN